MDTKCSKDGKCSCSKLIHIFSGVIFLLAGFFHLIRVFMGAALTLGDFVVPSWLSITAGIIAVALGALNICSCCCKKCKAHCCDSNEKKLN